MNEILDEVLALMVETAEFWFLVVVRAAEVQRILTMLVVKRAREAMIWTEFPL